MGTTWNPAMPAVAVIGCGYWGKNLVRNFYHLGALAMVCDSTEAGRAAAMQIAPTFRSLPVLMKSPPAPS
jgi:hypothetical protein